MAATTTVLSRSPSARMTTRQFELFDQLMALFLTEGFLGFTLDDLAVRLRCSKSTLYALAPSKEQLTIAVIVQFFRRAAERIEARISAEKDALSRIGTYLRTVAEELRPASSRFHDDLAAFAPARHVYERNTQLAAERVRALIAEGVHSGQFRQVHAEFVGAAIANIMASIQRSDLALSQPLSDADAYQELASLVLHGIASRAADEPR